MHVALPWLNVVHVELAYWTWVVPRVMLGLVTLTSGATWLNFIGQEDLMVHNVLGGKVGFSLELGFGLTNMLLAHLVSSDIISH